MEMTKEQKLLFIVTIFPMVRDFLEDVKDEYPKIFKQRLKKTTNDLIAEIDKLGYEVTDLYEADDIEEVRQQYQDIYMVHLGIVKELI